MSRELTRKARIFLFVFIRVYLRPNTYKMYRDKSWSFTMSASIFFT
jgi:hypothetical protein